MSFNNCQEGIIFNWVLALPENPEGRNAYFVKNGSGTTMYVTDGQGVPYLVGVGGGEITLTSPNGTISINGYGIDISQDVLDTIISLHNDFPDLQGGIDGERYHLSQSQHERVLDLIYQNNEVTFSNSPTTGERGFSTPITLSYNIQSQDDTITSASINQGVGSVLSGVDQGASSVSGGNKSITTTYTLSIGYNRNGNPFSENYNTTYTAYLPQWSGLSTQDDLNTQNYTQISAELNKVVQSGDTISVNVTPDDEYLWFVSSNTNATITNSGFNVIIGNFGDNAALFWKVLVNLTLADGITTSTLAFYRSRTTLNHSTQNYTIT